MFYKAFASILLKCSKYPYKIIQPPIARLSVLPDCLCGRTVCIARLCALPSLAGLSRGSWRFLGPGPRPRPARLQEPGNRMGGKFHDLPFQVSRRGMAWGRLLVLWRGLMANLMANFFAIRPAIRPSIRLFSNGSLMAGGGYLVKVLWRSYGGFFLDKIFFEYNTVGRFWRVAGLESLASCGALWQRITRRSHTL